MAIGQKLEASREVTSYVGGIPIENFRRTCVSFLQASADHVLLILAGELAGRNEKKGPTLPRALGTGSHTEAKEPEVEIFFELVRFRIDHPVVRHQRDMDETESVLENRSDLSFKRLVSVRCVDGFVRYLHDAAVLSGSWTNR